MAFRRSQSLNTNPFKITWSITVRTAHALAVGRTISRCAKPRKELAYHRTGPAVAGDTPLNYAGLQAYTTFVNPLTAQICRRHSPCRAYVVINLEEI
jgi:hypothetical protein